MEILLFGITKDIIGEHKLVLPSEGNIKTVSELKHWLGEKYPALKNLSSLAVAVNNEYADNNVALSSNSEVALLPPVSGG